MSTNNSAPKSSASGGFMADLPSNLMAGFMVFLIALPLCLAIATASGCPAIAGVFTAIAGGVITTFISNSQLTIKGPAAGLIVIVLGCVTDYTAVLIDREQASVEVTPAVAMADAHAATSVEKESPAKPKISDNRMAEIRKQAYRYTLAVCVVAGALQIVFGLFRAGVLGEFFPSSAVHGLLAAIGVIIIAKQIPLALGIPKDALLNHEGKTLEPLELIIRLFNPQTYTFLNPEIALIGSVSLLIMFGLPMLASKWPGLKKVPSQLIVLLVAISLSQFIGLPTRGTNGAEVDKTYMVLGKEFRLSPKTHLVDVPKNIVEGIASPDFGGLAYTAIAAKWIIMFALIGSLESLLSAKAIDLLDPLKRKTNLDRDLLAVGVANTAVAFVGGIPMISEIVRSRANIDNGAKSKFSDMFHALFLLGFVALVPSLLHLIPLAALAAMLIFTGFRLAHPREFMHVLHIGREQLVVFVATIVGILATDLLIGIFIGIGVKLLIHYINGVPLLSIFKPFLTIEQQDENTYIIKAQRSAVFSNWLQFRQQIYNYGLLQDKNLIVDMTDTQLVDHTVMQKLTETQQDFEAKGLAFTIVGLDQHIAMSEHPLSARRRGAVQLSSEPVHH